MCLLRLRWRSCTRPAVEALLVWTPISVPPALNTAPLPHLVPKQRTPLPPAAANWPCTAMRHPAAPRRRAAACCSRSWTRMRAGSGAVRWGWAGIDAVDALRSRSGGRPPSSATSNPAISPPLPCSAMLDGRSEHMPVSELAGGARIRHIFQVRGLICVESGQPGLEASSWLLWRWPWSGTLHLCWLCSSGGLHSAHVAGAVHRPTHAASNAARLWQEIFNAGLEELDPTRCALNRKCCGTKQQQSAVRANHAAGCTATQGRTGTAVLPSRH